jgi:hypothetical protein
MSRLNSVAVSAALFAVCAAEGRLLCMNRGVPVFTENHEWQCDCLPGYAGLFCEDIDDAKKDGTLEGITNLLLCAFFLLILPTLILYLIRTIYLCLKRWGQTRAVTVSIVPVHPTHSQGTVTLSLRENVRPPLRSSSSHGVVPLHATNSQGTVSLSLHDHRPLHGTASHGTVSLSLHEFNELLSNMQRPPSYESVVHTTSYGAL